MSKNSKNGKDKNKIKNLSHGSEGFQQTNVKVKKHSPAVLNSAQFLPGVLQVGKSDLKKSTPLDTVLSTLDDIQQTEDIQAATFAQLQRIIKDVGNTQANLHKNYNLKAVRNRKMYQDKEDTPNPDIDEEIKPLDDVFDNDKEKQEGENLAL